MAIRSASFRQRRQGSVAINANGTLTHNAR
jgi:hypothetical protein